jgi:hypothetical protein
MRYRFTSNANWVTLLLATALLSSCCTVRVYKGEALPRDKVAYVKNLMRVEFTEINKGCRAEVPGGVVKAVIGNSDAAQLVPFIAEPGHTYAGKKLWADSNMPFREKWYYWIEDTNTGKVVSGTKPK